MNNQTSLIATLNFNAFADPALEAYNMLYVAVKKMLDKRGLQVYNQNPEQSTGGHPHPKALAVFLCPIALYGGRGEPSVSRSHSPVAVSESVTLTSVASEKTTGGHHADRTHRRHLWQTYVTYSYKTLFYGGAL